MSKILKSDKDKDKDKDKEYHFPERSIHYINKHLEAIYKIEMRIFKQLVDH